MSRHTRGGRPRPFTPITIVVGDPIFFTADDLVGEKRDLYQRLSDRVMARIAAIENLRGSEEPYRGSG